MRKGKKLNHTIAAMAVLAVAAPAGAGAAGERDDRYGSGDSSRPGQAEGSADQGSRSSRSRSSEARRVLYATDSRNNLISFRVGSPRRAGSKRVTGLPAGVSLKGIDFRPANGDLYGLGSNSVIYRVNPRTAIALAEGPEFTPTLRGRSFGFDINPVPDRIRIASEANQDLRANPDGGQVVAVDGELSTAGRDPNVVGSAYENSRFSARRPTATELYALDSANNTVYTQNPPNSGTLVEPQKLGFDVRDSAGFDIAGPRNVGYVATGGRLYRVDVDNGRSRSLGRIGRRGGRTVTGLAADQG